MGRYTLTINAIGGLCNRLRAIATGVHLSDATDRTLNVIWNNNKDLGACFCDLFNPLPEGIIVHTPSKLNYYFKWEIPRKKNFYLSRLYQKTRYKASFSDDYGLKDFQDQEEALLYKLRQINGDILITTGTAIGGYDTEKMRQMFRPSPQVKELINNKISGFDENTIGVHIRRTDNHQSIAHSPTAIFITQMERKIELNGRTKFFIASDDPKIMMELADRFGDRAMCGDMYASRKTLSGMLHATADLWALSKTKEILGSYYSSYSEIAALLGNIPITIISKP